MKNPALYGGGVVARFSARLRISFFLIEEFRLDDLVVERTVSVKLESLDLNPGFTDELLETAFFAVVGDECTLAPRICQPREGAGIGLEKVSFVLEVSDDRNTLP